MRGFVSDGLRECLVDVEVIGGRIKMTDDAITVASSFRSFCRGIRNRRIIGVGY